MKNSSCLSYNFSMTFNKEKLLEMLLKDIDPYFLGLLCGELAGRDLFLPNNINNLVSFITYTIQEYEIKLEDDDWYLFVIGLLKSMYELYGYERDYSVEWIIMESDEVLSEESRILLSCSTENGKKHLCVTLFGKD